MGCNLVTEGYVPCACRDCMEIAIGKRGEAFCSLCEEAGCGGGEEAECARDDAYGCDEYGDPDATEPDDEDWVTADHIKTLTYGVLPSREEFDAAFEATCPVASVAIANERAFAFTNDPRVGTCELTASELWAELEKARGEWTEGCAQCTDGTDTCDASHEVAGQWCSDVLGVLGFEWV